MLSTFSDFSIHLFVINGTVQISRMKVRNHSEEFCFVFTQNPVVLAQQNATDAVIFAYLLELYILHYYYKKYLKISADNEEFNCDTRAISNKKMA